MKTSLIAPGKALGHSQIYLDFQAGVENARRFYFCDDPARVAKALDKATFPREQMAAILEKQNRVYGASDKTFESIEKLKQPSAVCVFSGQQAGLFSGPFLVVLKALAIAKAAALYEKQLDRPVVPVFWIAGDDHDFDEANHTYVLNREGEPTLISYQTRPELEMPTSQIAFTNEVELHRVKQLLKDTLGTTDFTTDLYDLIERAYTIEDTFVTAFGKFMAALTRNLGVVFFSPGDDEVKKIALPLFKAILEKQDTLHDTLTATNDSIEKAGYHIQVEKKDNSSHLFCNLEGRKPVMREGDGFRIGDRLFTKEEMLECMEKHSDRCSTDVITRPVLQSYLFPVISQKGGPAEIAYLAQINPLFELFGTVPPCHVGRASATLLEKRFEKIMHEHEIEFGELTGDIEQVINRVLMASFPHDLDEKFNKLRNDVRTDFIDFTEDSLRFDPALAKFAEQIMGKVDFNLNAFEGKVFSSHKKKSQQTRDRIYRLGHGVFTNRGLHERSLNITYFLAKYGIGLIDYIYEALDSEEKAHQIIHLSEFEG